MEKKQSTLRSSRRKPSFLDTYGPLSKNGFAQVARNLAKNLSPTKQKAATSTPPQSKESANDSVYISWSGFDEHKEEEMVS